MPRERDIRRAVADALNATGAFDAVWIADPDDPTGNAASNWRAAGIRPGATTLLQGFDGAAGGGLVYRCQIPLTLVSRHEDQQVRDELAEELLNVARNALNGRGLGGLAIAQQTIVRSWTWMPPSPPERQVRAVIELHYLEEGWASSDTTE
jgi:hypothetical protein